MTTITRNDAWTQEQDELLASTVLQYLREGKTQKEAFEFVAEKLDRTSAGVAFRWNDSVRKRYKTSINSAKKIGKMQKQKPLKNEKKHSVKKSRQKVVTLKENTEPSEAILQNPVPAKTNSIKNLTGLTETLTQIEVLFENKELELQSLKTELEETKKSLASQETYREILKENVLLKKRVKELEEQLAEISDLMTAVRNFEFKVTKNRYDYLPTDEDIAI